MIRLNRRSAFRARREQLRRTACAETLASARPGLSGWHRPRYDDLAWFSDIDVETSPPSERATWAIDLPKRRTRHYGTRIEITGWAVGRTSRAVGVEADSRGQQPARANIVLARPDVAAALPDVADASRSGFSILAGVSEARQTSIRLSVVLEGGEPLPVGVIHLAKRWDDRWHGPDAPLVSVVIPCFNQGHFLRECLQSVMHQSYPRIEAIVVDDGSTDDTATVAGEFPVSFVAQENRGLAQARNRGLAESTGEYVVFLDADDRLLPHGVEANIAAFEGRSDLAFVSGWHWPITAAGEVVESRPPPLLPERDHYATLLQGGHLPSAGCVMFRRDAVIAAGGFETSVPGAEDMDLYLRLAREHVVSAHSVHVLEYRRHGDSLSRNSALMLASALGALRAQRKSARERALSSAYECGVSRVREWFGEPAAEQLALAVRQRQWSESLRAAGVLLRWYPRGLASAFSHLRNASSVPTPSD